MNKLQSLKDSAAALGITLSDADHESLLAGRAVAMPAQKASCCPEGAIPIGAKPTWCITLWPKPSVSICWGD